MSLKSTRIACLLLVWATAAYAKPNVVFVLTDDQGYGDLSCHGNPVLKTPNLDTLHGESVRFTDYHVSPTCAPTRGALMSGHWTNRAGPWHTIMGRSMLYEGEETFGTVFSAGGYATGMFGKWHLGDNYPFRPEDRGFQEVVRHGGGGVGQTPDNWDNAYFDDTYFHNGVPEKYSGYCTDVYFQEAKRFISESVNNNKPFMAYICTNAPHSPFHCPDKYWKPYSEQGLDDRTAIFYGMIANIDENVGKMRSWLAKKGLADNTIFIFMTDNGTASGEQVHNSGMRGKKGSEYEGGHRVPFFVHWPKGNIAHGKDVKPVTGHIDVLPTLIELCGLEKPAGYKFDGTSFASLLRDPGAAWPDRVLITDSQRVRDPIKWRKCSTMTDRWRLINGTELYDIKKDPGQKTDVAKQHPEVVKKLRAEYDAWWADISPVFSKDSRIIIGNKAESPTRLTAHDWLTDGSLPPWNQSHIRKSQVTTGEWAIKVEKAGKYRITLRRWPAVVPKAITADLPPGAPVQGITAYRETPGKGLDAKLAGIKIAGIAQQKPVGVSDQKVSFSVNLEKGEANLEGYFVLNDAKKIGSYYAYVELVESRTRRPRKRLTFDERFSDDLEQTPDSEARLDKWFRDAKFGAFIHFGAYSPFAGEYKGRGAAFHYSEWLQVSAKIPADEYHQLAARFNPSEFDAEEWVQVFKDAGIRYVVITSKHHDGFALFKSSVSPYNIVDATEFKRDIIKELSEACHRKGLKFGVYYSHAQDWDEPDAPYLNNRAKLSDLHPELPADFKQDMERYIEKKSLPQVEELVKNYELDMLWFDTPVGMTYERAERFRDMVRRYRPDCVINSRIIYRGKDKIHQKDLPLFDYVAIGDKEVPTKKLPLYFESPDSVSSSYGYKTHGDHYYHTEKDLIDRLVHTVCSGGNYLLNNGPMGNGELDPEAIRLYRAIGTWMKTNSESLIGTRQNPLPDRPTWGDVSVNKAGNVLYLHVLDWPETSTISLDDLPVKATRAIYLANGKKADFAQDGDTLNFTLAKRQVDEYNTVIKVTLAKSIHSE